MVQVNLLPWREQQRQAKKMYFLIVIGIAIAITIVFIFLTHIYLNNKITQQMDRNTFLQTTLTKEQANIATLETQLKQQSQIHTQLHFIFSLRDNSYQAARFLDILTRVVPDGVSLSALSWEENKIILLGKTRSDFQVTLFMKNITNTKLFKQPALTEITSKKNADGTEEKHFQLHLEQQELQ